MLRGERARKEGRKIFDKKSNYFIPKFLYFTDETKHKTKDIKIKIVFETIF